MFIKQINDTTVIRYATTNWNGVDDVTNREIYRSICTEKIEITKVVNSIVLALESNSRIVGTYVYTIHIVYNAYSEYIEYSYWLGEAL